MFSHSHQWRSMLYMVGWMVINSDTDLIHTPRMQQHDSCDLRCIAFSHWNHPLTQCDITMRKNQIQPKMKAGPNNDTRPILIGLEPEPDLARIMTRCIITLQYLEGMMFMKYRLHRNKEIGNYRWHELNIQLGATYKWGRSWVVMHTLW